MEPITLGLGVVALISTSAAGYLFYANRKQRQYAEDLWKTYECQEEKLWIYEKAHAKNQAVVKGLKKKVDDIQWSISSNANHIINKIYWS